MITKEKLGELLINLSEMTYQVITENEKEIEDESRMSLISVLTKKFAEIIERFEKENLEE